MKKIISHKLQTALLRGAVLLSGGMATIMIALFCDSIYGVIATLFLGTGMIALIDDVIINSNNK